jgi:hypothetical protein
MVGPPEDRKFLLRPVGIVMVAQQETAIQRTTWHGRNPPQLQLEDDWNQVQATLFFMRRDPTVFPARNVTTANRNGSRRVLREKGGETEREREREKRQKEPAPSGESGRTLEGFHHGRGHIFVVWGSCLYGLTQATECYVLDRTDHIADHQQPLPLLARKKGREKRKGTKEIKKRKRKEERVTFDPPREESSRRLFSILSIQAPLINLTL